ncbi:EID1-like F-box protein 3 [Andrographis paniculata]|uniref:EID1-like F-box protein 3 n=1 Tax=Andrographis paniculata TaxID=175694 RepID=UPI0021E7D47B|nr:EID1-like F-box protein 3 [Andrographis paniculata]
MSLGAGSSSTRSARLTESAEPGIHNEKILLLVFESMKWDIRTVCRTASVDRRLRAVAKRLLWRELCIYRARRMMSAVAEGGRVIGGWPAMAKLLFFCGGCESPVRHFDPRRPEPGHFVESSRFSKTSGLSFLRKDCREDVLYVTDPCEHRSGGGGGGEGEDVGIYRGVFRSFQRSRTRECLVRRQVEFEDGIRCPYCGTRVWSMTAARMIPRKSAARRLGSRDGAGGLEYFVCLNGHLHGMCWLVSLSSSDDDDGISDGDGRSRFTGSSSSSSG